MDRFERMMQASLRLSDVAPTKARALEMQRQRNGNFTIMDGGLGDPVRFGFTAPRRLQQAFEDVVRTPASYTESTGFPPLIEELSHFNHRVEGDVVTTDRIGPDSLIFTGAGSSGVVRHYMQVIAGGKSGKAVVFIPKLTYPLFLAETNFVDAESVTVPVDEKTGIVDPERLKSIMSAKIEQYGREVDYIFVTTTIGNPLGTAMSAATFDEVTFVLSNLARQHNVRVHRITDPTYEPFRRDQSTRFNIIGKVQHGGPVIELVTGTRSKSECWPGQRMGHGIVITDFEKLRRDISIALAITLNPTSIHAQMAVAKWLHDQRTDKEAFRDEINRQNAMRETVNCNVFGFAQALSEIPGVELHPSYFTDGQLSPENLNSFYVLWRFVCDRTSSSQAAQVAQWTLNRALSEISTGGQKTPVVLFNDGYMFLHPDDRPAAKEYIRTVALWDADSSAQIVELIREAAQYVVKHGRMPEI